MKRIKKNLKHILKYVLRIPFYIHFGFKRLQFVKKAKKNVGL
jgi:hypothetical protein